MVEFDIDICLLLFRSLTNGTYTLQNNVTNLNSTKFIVTWLKYLDVVRGEGVLDTSDESGWQQGKLNPTAK